MFHLNLLGRSLGSSGESLAGGTLTLSLQDSKSIAESHNPVCYSGNRACQGHLSACTLCLSNLLQSRCESGRGTSARFSCRIHGYLEGLPGLR